MQSLHFKFQAFRGVDVIRQNAIKCYFKDGVAESDCSRTNKELNVWNLCNGHASIVEER